MYRKIDTCTVVSDDQGFEVLLDIGRCIIEYRDGERLLKIKMERGYRPGRAVVYSASIDQWEPPDNSPIDAADQARILNNVKESLEVLECPYRIV